ncbi:MAG TPA: PadR family transcriptional regulator [Candidatus Limnocylindrales bacterium]
MAKRRKVGNLMALALLSVLAHEEPMHTYEMARALRAFGKDEDMDIKWGSLYTVVQNLERHNFIEAVESSQVGRRPERTVYTITEMGRRELIDWTRELVSTPQRGANPFRAGLSVISVLSPREAEELLRRRLSAVEREAAAVRELMRSHSVTFPRLFMVEDEYMLAVLEAEAAWVRGLVDELASGSFPDLKMWQKGHETGQIPEELAELAKKAIAEQK